MKSALLALLCAASAHAGVSVLAEWDEETGDFGGAPFPLRSEFETFINTDGSGNVVSYGFYIPLLSRLGLDYTDFDPDRPDPPRGAALDFEWQTLPNPSQMPYRFVGLNFNPNGHPGEEFLIPHFDIHLWLYGSEFSKGLQCEGTSFAPCNTTDYLEARFALSPPQEYYPTGYINNPAEWVATMGAHLLPNPIPDTFDTIPSAIFGSYNGEIIYHEPMIANTILLDVEANGPKDFAWPSVTTYPNDGRFYTNMNIAVEGQRYRLTFNQLASNPSPIADLFTGSQHTPAEAMSAIPSATKDCFILSGGLYDVGYRVTAPSGSYCCRSRGDYNSVADSCTRSTCTSPTNLANPSDAFFARSDSVFCFARCYAA